MKGNENNRLRLVVSNPDPVGADSHFVRKPVSGRWESLEFIRNYSTREIVNILTEIREGSLKEPPERLQMLGEHAVSKVAKYIPEAFAHYPTAGDFFRNISLIFKESIRDKYPRELSFDFRIMHDSPNHIICHFETKVPSTDYTLGVFYGILDYYGVRETSSIARYNCSLEGNSALFDIRLANARHVPEEPCNSDEGAAA